MLIDELIDEFILDCEIRKFTAKTIKGYKNNLKYLMRFLEEKHSIINIEDVKTLHLKDFLKTISDQKRKETYLNSLLKNFRSFFKYAYNEKYIAVDPCVKVSWAKETLPLIETFTDSEVKKMLSVYSDNNYLDIRNKAIMYMLFDTGIRCYELCCLKTDSVKEDVINIFGKGKKERQVGKSPYLAKILLRYMRCRESYFKYKHINDSLFLSRTGNPLTIEAVERVVRIAGERANVRSNIRCSPHTCRHYFAQAQLRNGIDVYSLSRILGHNNISITQRYLYSLNDSDIVRKSIATSPLMKFM